MEALHFEEAMREIYARSIKPSEINLTNCFLYAFKDIPETMTASAIVRVCQDRGDCWGAVTETEVVVRFSGLIKGFRFSSLADREYLLQFGESYFPTEKLIKTCYDAVP
jgi:hypothetical protein